MKWQLLLGMFLSIKITTLVIVYLAFFLLPYCVPCHDGNFVYPKGEVIGPLVAYKTWDGQFYLYLAEKWYSPGHMGNAFRPLFPATIWVVAVILGGNYWLAGMILAQVYSVVAVWLFYLLVKRLFSLKVAGWSTVLLMTFPTAFYLHLVYSEALFLVLALGFFYGLYTKRFWLALVTGFLLPLSRDPGITLIVPLLLFLYTGSDSKFSARERVMLVAGMVMGWLVYMLVMKHWTGQWSGMYLHKTQFVSRHSLANVLHPIRWLDLNFLSWKPTLHGFNTSIINRLFFGVFVGLFWWGRRRVDRVLLSYMVMTGWLPALSGFFMSYPRVLLVVFPMYVIAGSYLKEKTWWVVFPMILLQGLLLVIHVLNYWVA